MRKTRLLSLLVLLMTAVTGAWAADGVKHTITASFGTDSQSMEQLLPYGTSIETVIYDMGYGMYISAANLTNAVSSNPDVVEIGTLNNWATEVSVKADGEAKVTLTLSIGMSLVINVSVAPVTYSVKMKEGAEDAANWTIASGDKSVKGNVAEGLTGLKEGDAVTLTYTGRLKVKGVKATSDAAPAEEPVTLATPLTIEAITDGTIQVNMSGELSTGMKYSTDGGTTKTTIYNTTNITVAKGDKVQFYGKGTSTQAYGNYPEVQIQGSGDGFQTKVYGNIMSLLDEEGFATKTDLPDESYVFYGLFADNTTLTDASELLLPAATLVGYACYQRMFYGCTSLTTAPKLPATTLAEYCYYNMFIGCTSLTTAPKLPATTLASSCYCNMFKGCTNLTSAYVKAAYTEANDACTSMFYGCTATGATLHTTSDNKASWEAVMGTGNDWENWSVAGDWED